MVTEYHSPILYLWGVFEVINHLMARVLVHHNKCHLEYDNIEINLGL